MNKRETAQFLAVIKTAYPHFEITEPVVRLWHEFLMEMPFDKAQANLREHIKSSRFPPTISEIVRATPEQYTDYDQLRIETADRLVLLEQWQETAADPPAHVLERWGKR